MKNFSFLLLILFLSACGTQSGAPVYKPLDGEQQSYFVPHNIKPAFYPIREIKQCVAHAREVTGVPIFGDAHTWWYQADGKYEKGSMPRVGSILVLSKTSRLKYGHLAVVKRVVDKRTIEVEHSNWGGTRQERCIVYTRMPVKDVSPANNWSQLRFWHYPSESFGSIYPAQGFIYAPPRIANIDE
jgi:hypothetical protein